MLNFAETGNCARMEEGSEEVTKTKSKLVKNILINIIDMKYPPNIPAYVLFGLILVNFGPLNIFPNKYPPISVNMQIKRIGKK